MFRKLNTKTLVIALIVLLAVVVGAYLMDQRNGERTFKASLVQTDTDAIDKIVLLPKGIKQKEIELKRDGGNWSVSQNGNRYPGDNSAILELINLLNPLKPESVVSSNPKHFKDFDVEDSTAIRVKLMQGANVVADLLIGKLEMSSGYNVNSYVRLSNDKVVYSVAGYLSMSANRDLDAYRNHKVMDGNKSNWSKLEFTYPADSSFVLEKQSEGKWHIGAVEVNAADVDKFLDQLQHLNHSKFTTSLPPSNPNYQLRITGSKLAAPIEVNGYSSVSENFVISSSLNNGNLFDGKDLREKLFPGKGIFLKK